MISVLINGICGQMGRAVYAACQAQSGAFSVAAGVDVSGCDAFACPVYRNMDNVTEPVDVVVDFSVPASIPSVLRFAQLKKIPVIIGTTGLGEREYKLIRSASERIPVFQTGNMSLGVNLQLELIQLASATLGNAFDVEIIETHHRMKVDAPSGTALQMGEVIAAALGRELKDCAVYERYGHTGERDPSTIGFATIRGGDIVGDHTVLFAGTGERIEISHKSSNRQGYAQGSLRAVRFLAGKRSGLFDMADVLGLK